MAGKKNALTGLAFGELGTWQETGCGHSSRCFPVVPSSQKPWHTEDQQMLDLIKTGQLGPSGPGQSCHAAVEGCLQWTFMMAVQSHEFLRYWLFADSPSLDHPSATKVLVVPCHEPIYSKPTNSHSWLMVIT